MDAVEGAEQVGLDDGPEVVAGHLVDRREAADTGVVDQDVEPSGLALDPRDQASTSACTRTLQRAASTSSRMALVELAPGRLEHLRSGRRRRRGARAPAALRRWRA
ncbi:MAG: hypothetical protein R2862_12665 [Thermoanaerobaculia bacterium]